MAGLFVDSMAYERCRLTHAILNAVCDGNDKDE
jgi:hypothetical protein